MSINQKLPLIAISLAFTITILKVISKFLLVNDVKHLFTIVTMLHNRTHSITKTVSTNLAAQTSIYQNGLFRD